MRKGGGVLLALGGVLLLKGSGSSEPGKSGSGGAANDLPKSADGVPSPPEPVIFPAVVSSGGGARDLNRTQALDWLRGMQVSGGVKFAAAKQVAHRVDLLDVAGVNFTYRGKRLMPHDVEPRAAVMMARLALESRAVWGVHTITHAGTYPGGPDTLGPHNRGGAIDVTGFEGSGWSLSVAKDWGALASYAVVGGKRPFRIPNDAAHAWARKVFSWLYLWATDECSDVSGVPGGNTRRSNIGEESHIVTPDHPGEREFKLHQDHVHLQVGSMSVLDASG